MSRSQTQSAGEGPSALNEMTVKVEKEKKKTGSIIDFISWIMKERGDRTGSEVKEAFNTLR